LLLLLDRRLVCQPFGTEKGYAFPVTGTYGRLGVGQDLTFAIRGVAIRH